MKISLEGFRPPERPPGIWVDRFGPWILSACFHAILASLIFSGLVANTEVVQRTLRISLARAFPKPEEPPRVSASLAPPPPARANAARPVPENPAEPATTAASIPAPAPQPAEAQATAPVNVPSASDQEARIQRILADYGPKLQTGRQDLLGERQDLGDRLETADLQAAAAPHFPGYSGARVGAIRTLTFDNADPVTAREVMARYEIRVTNNRFMSQSGPSYLNSAASGGSVFTAQTKPGFYDVFEISAKAYQRMVLLEQNWLVSRGYDPSTTRVDTVEFGIARVGARYDLTILKMEVQSVGELGRPTIPSAGPGSKAALPDGAVSPIK